MDCHRVTAVELENLERLGKLRGFDMSDMRRFPSTGLVCGPCFGFLYVTNSSVAYLDSFICEKSASTKDRKYAFGRIFRGLRLLARLKGCTTVVGHTSHSNCLSAASSAGFDIFNTGSSFLMKEIR